MSFLKILEIVLGLPKASGSGKVRTSERFRRHTQLFFWKFWVKWAFDRKLWTFDGKIFLIFKAFSLNIRKI
jgi:hypothetical protein